MDKSYVDLSKNEIFIPDYALAVMDVLTSAGEEVYIVGGCVRDSLLGVIPHDYDMTLSCAPERTLELLSPHFRTVATGLKHGTVTAISSGNPIELTTFRVDGSYTDSRRPDSVSFTRSVSDDLSRRDFTVNAMAYNPHSGLIDLFGGREDIEKRIIRAVGEPERRFSEDALRIMRAFRFSAQLGFSIDPDTLSGASSTSSGLANIARERIGSEFISLLCSPYPAEPLRLMREHGILDYATLGYSPSDSVISLLSSMPSADTARLGFYLCEADESLSREILNSLKCSNKQKSGALCISRECRSKIENELDAARLCGRAGEHAPFAARASALLEISPSFAVDLVEKNASPRSVGDLAIGGRELISLGFKGAEIGLELARLLEAALQEPSLNREDTLLSLAKKHKEEGK